MRCYNHPTDSAIGVCTVCGRGLCRECKANTGSAITCKETCNTPQSSKNNLCVELQKKFAGIFAITALMYLLSGMILLIAGFTFRTLFGIYIIIPLGIVFMISALLQYTATKRFIDN